MIYTPVPVSTGDHLVPCFEATRSQAAFSWATEKSLDRTRKGVFLVQEVHLGRIAQLAYCLIWVLRKHLLINLR